MLKVYEWTEPFHGSGHSGLFVKTHNLDSLVARLEAAGVEHRDIRVHDWGGRSCSVFDPSGNIFDLIDAGQIGNV